jgi:mannose-6-phosphate isomerase-like protein (cupin superfamily)
MENAMNMLRFPEVDASCLPGGASAELPHAIQKPWGYELLWAWHRYYAAKILHIQAGHRLSLQYHRVKEETLFLVRGRLTLELEGPNASLQQIEVLPGQVFHIDRGRKHRFAALEDSDVLEVSTPELDDLVRLHDDYGRP